MDQFARRWGNNNAPHYDSGPHPTKNLDEALIDTLHLVMTEYSIGINIGGKETLVPSLVPTLSKAEIEFLRTKEDAVPIPEAIQRKAADHAKKMIEQGKSPFYQSSKKKKSLIK